MSIHAANVRRALLAALTSLLLVGGLAVLPSSASAGIDVRYCDEVVAPFSACPRWHPPHFRSDNSAIYPGWQTRGVCIKTLLGADWSVVERICGNNWVQGTYAYSLSSWGWSTITFSGNDSQWYHTNHGESIIWAHAYSARAANGGDSFNDGPLVRGEPVALSEVAAATERLPTVPAAQAPAAALRSVSALRSADSGKVATLSRVDDQVTLRTTAEKLCLSASATGGQISCQDYDKVLTGDLIAAAHCGLNVPDDTVVLYGVVPDGVTGVTVTNAKGAAIATSEVTGNTYRVAIPTEVASGVAALRWSGKTETTKPLTNIIGDKPGC